jgi:PAS domain S-box-containing protein
MFALGPLVVMFLSSQLGPGWKPVRLTFLAISILCYAMRMGINEHRQTINAELVERQMQAMNSSVDGMAIVDATGKFVYVNSEYARMCGQVSAAEMQGKPWRDVAPKEDTDRVEAEIRDGLKKRGRWFGEMVLQDGNGKGLAVEITVTAMNDGGVVLVCRDLTERKRAEEAKADAESKYRMIVERVAAISYVAELGMEGRWIYVSPQIENILGYTQEEWLIDSRNWVRFVHPDDLAAVVDAEESCQEGLAFQAEYRVMRNSKGNCSSRDGWKRWDVLPEGSRTTSTTC